MDDLFTKWLDTKQAERKRNAAAISASKPKIIISKAVAATSASSLNTSHKQGIVMDTGSDEHIRKYAPSTRPAEQPLAFDTVNRITKTDTVTDVSVPGGTVVAVKRIFYKTVKKSTVLER